MGGDIYYYPSRYHHHHQHHRQPPSPTSRGRTMLISNKQGNNTIIITHQQQHQHKRKASNYARPQEVDSSSSSSSASSPFPSSPSSSSKLFIENNNNENNNKNNNKNNHIVVNNNISSNNNYENNKTTIFSKIGPRGVPPISMNVKDMDDSSLVMLSKLENHCAREEILIRHIMDIEYCSYKEATRIFNEQISKTNLEGYYYSYKLPYYVGIYTAIGVGVATVPLVFHLPTIEWFNEWAVTTDIPEARDLETPLEVSIWSWNWMEPPLGTMSFLLLCSQYVRSQMANLGIKPYTRYIKRRRGEKLANAYPQYDSKILIAYSETAKLH